MTAGAPRIRRLDTSNDAELRDWYDTCVASTSAGRPDFVPRPFEHQVRQVLDPDLGSERHDVVALVDGRVRASVMVWYSTEDNLDTAWLILDVHPGWRRQGLGAALLDAAIAQLPPERTEFTMPSKVPADQVDSHPYRLFAEAVGWTLSTVGTVRRLPWPVQESLLDELDPGPQPGYRIQTHVDGIPEDHQEAVGWLKGLVDVDSPTGDVEYEPSPLSPEHYREELRRANASGSRYVESIAVEEATGAAVGFTMVEVEASADRPILQEGTLVLREHRGHRLGMALKIANLRQLLAMDLPHAAVSTGNDDENGPMVGINHALGFIDYEAELIFVRRR